MVTGMQGSRARSALADSTFSDVRWVSETASTNDDLHALAVDGAPEGVVIVADHQSAGRGRLDRSWQAPSGSSLLVSMLVRPGLAVDQTHLVTAAVACSAVQACVDVADYEPSLKWPNDVVVLAESGDVQGKLAGVLAESVVVRDQIDAVVVGIGLNVNWPAQLPDDLQGIAIALNHVVGHEVDREDLLIALLRRLHQWRAALTDPAGRDRLMQRYRDSCSTLGAKVRVDLLTESFDGTAVDVTSDGHLVVDTERGRRVVVAGDVVHLRTS
jgi:BirA family biotin operon repressor/biotin-[acetyl-CoA-carboxylase] ligase